MLCLIRIETVLMECNKWKLVRLIGTSGREGVTMRCQHQSIVDTYILLFLLFLQFAPFLLLINKTLNQ
jgi:hypothetical protein